MKIESVKSLFEEEIKDLYDAEKQLVRALPKVAKAATTEDLVKAFSRTPCSDKDARQPARKGIPANWSEAQEQIL